MQSETTTASTRSLANDNLSGAPRRDRQGVTRAPSTAFVHAALSTRGARQPTSQPVTEYG